MASIYDLNLLNVIINYAYAPSSHLAVVHQIEELARECNHSKTNFWFSQWYFDALEVYQYNQEVLKSMDDYDGAIDRAIIHASIFDLDYEYD